MPPACGPAPDLAFTLWRCGQVTGSRKVGWDPCTADGQKCGSASVRFPNLLLCLSFNVLKRSRLARLAPPEVQTFVLETLGLSYPNCSSTPSSSRPIPGPKNELQQRPEEPGPRHKRSPRSCCYGMGWDKVADALCKNPLCTWPLSLCASQGPRPLSGLDGATEDSATAQCHVLSPLLGLGLLPRAGGTLQHGRKPTGVQPPRPGMAQDVWSSRGDSSLVHSLLASRGSKYKKNRVAEQLRSLSLISSCLRTEPPCSQTNHPAQHLPQGFPATQHSGASGYSDS